MVSDVARLTPLHGAVHRENGLVLCERAFVRKWIFRLQRESAAAAKVAEALSLSLPEACRFVSDTPADATRLSWLGPDEFLLYCAADVEGSRLASLRAALVGDAAFAPVEVSDYYTVLRVCGDAAALLLNSECPLDLRLRSFPVGSCAGSLFAHANILLSRVEETAFDIQVRWSFAAYLWSHLCGGMRYL